MSNLNDADDKDKSQTVDWKSYLQRSKHAILNNVHNASLVIENDDEYKGMHAYNEMSRSDVRMNGKSYIDISDKYLMSVQHFIQTNYINNMTLDTVRTAILLDCQRNRFHPVFNFLENLKWDGVPRLENWAPVYLGAQDNPYNQKVGRYFVISMIARIYKPGCKCDYMLVLEGDQGIGKSKACSILFGRYFSDYLPDIASKDACHHVSSFWGIEIAEMHVFTRAETAALKSFISRTEEQYRPPYGRMEVRLPRQCIFIGTTNQDRYLKDETGGRRFWPVKCGRIDIQKLKDDRNQLLAEAVVRFKKGWAWWPDQEFEEHTIKPEQAERQEFDELENILINQIRLGMGGDRIKRMTVAEIFQVVLNQGSERLPTHGEQIRIGKILTRLESTGVIGSVKVMGKKHYDLTNLKSEPS